MPISPSTSGRTIAIGDVHGCLAALETVLQAFQPRPDDTIVTLGDYVDRGPDSRGAIDRLIALQEQCRLVPLLGNHDEMLLEICAGRLYLMEDWLVFGGDATVASYGGRVPEGVPAGHLAFLQACRLYYETERHLFVHGNYWATLPLDQQHSRVLLWESLKLRQPGPHCSGKLAIVGHTAQKSGEILDLGYLKCIDTCCYGSGWLTALDVDSGRVWQADQQGRLREQM
jgi:serine/threonine protein phosphatase 1